MSLLPLERRYVAFIDEEQQLLYVCCVRSLLKVHFFMGDWYVYAAAQHSSRVN